MSRFWMSVGALALLLPGFASAQDDRRRDDQAHPAAAHPARPEAARPAPPPQSHPPQVGGYHPAPTPSPPAQRPPEGGGYHQGTGGPPPHGEQRAYQSGGYHGVQGAGRSFVYLGHPHPRFHGPEFRYPPGFAYRRWSIGERLPFIFLTADYVFADYAALGLDPPPYGYEWVRYGPDLLLVQLGTGQVVEIVPGAIY